MTESETTDRRRGSGPDRIRTLIVDDEAPARSRIRKLLSVDPDIAVIGVFSSWDAIERNCDFSLSSSCSFS